MRFLWERLNPIWRRLGKYQLEPYPRAIQIAANILQGITWLIWSRIDRWKDYQEGYIERWQR